MSKLKPTPYNMRMTNQTIVKPLGLIKDLKILVHEIPYAMTFTIIQSSVLNSSLLVLRMNNHYYKMWVQFTSPCSLDQ